MNRQLKLSFSFTLCLLFLNISMETEAADFRQNLRTDQEIESSTIINSFRQSEKILKKQALTNRNSKNRLKNVNSDRIRKLSIVTLILGIISLVSAPPLLFVPGGFVLSLGLAFAALITGIISLSLIRKSDENHRKYKNLSTIGIVVAILRIVIFILVIGFLTFIL